jgi:prevent-host-death family protein
MLTVASREFQTQYGLILDKVRSGACVSVTNHGRPAFYVFPHNEDTAFILRRTAGRRLSQKLKNLTPNAEAAALTPDQINQLMHDA